MNIYHEFYTAKEASLVCSAVSNVRKFLKDYAPDWKTSVKLTQNKVGKEVTEVTIETQTSLSVTASFEQYYLIKGFIEGFITAAKSKNDN